VISVSISESQLPGGRWALREYSEGASWTQYVRV